MLPQQLPPDETFFFLVPMCFEYKSLFTQRKREKTVFFCKGMEVLLNDGKHENKEVQTRCELHISEDIPTKCDAIEYSTTSLRGALLALKARHATMFARLECYFHLLVIILAQLLMLTLASACIYYGVVYEQTSNLAYWNQLAGIISLSFQLGWQIPLAHIFPPILNKRTRRAVSKRRRMEHDVMPFIGFSLHVMLLVQGWFVLENSKNSSRELWTFSFFVIHVSTAACAALLLCKLMILIFQKLNAGFVLVEQTVVQ